MKQPILARQDEAAVNQVLSNLPQALLIVAEPGLDSERLINKIVDNQPSDIFSLVPEKNKKNIAVNQVRELIISLRTHAIRRRVVIIQSADTMNEESQNALLKILEEPSEKLYFILETTNISGIIPTILSRCQSLILHRTSPLQDAKLLKESDVHEQTKQQILFLAAGRPALIRQLMSKKTMLENYRELATDAKKIMQSPPYEALITAQKYANSRENALQLLDVLMTITKFQIKSSGIISPLVERIHLAESSLKSNGHVKLALLKLVV